MKAKCSLVSALLLFLPFASALGAAYTVNLVPGWNAIANQLSQPNSTLGGVMASVPDGTVILFWQTASQNFVRFTYLDFADFRGWIDDNANSADATPFPPGVGALLFNPLSTSFSLTISGAANIPTLPLAVPINALALVARQTNGLGTYENILGRQPGQGARVLRLIPGCGSPSGPDPTNCYTEHVFMNGAWLPAVPTAAVGEAVFIVRSDKPSIASQPASQTVNQGSNATFTVSAVGPPPLAYQWRFNGTDIPGATGAAFTVTNAQPTNAGNYAVVVSNSSGSVPSAVAVLTINTAPVIVTQPQSQPVAQGSNATFSVVAAGTAPLTYQWRFNDVDIPGAIGPTFTVTNAQPANAGNYTVVVSNSVGSVTSAVAALTFQLPPVITLQPRSVTNFAAPAGATFTVEATGTGSLTYQWFRDGVRLDGKTMPTLTIEGEMLPTVYVYTVVVKNTVGQVTSDAALFILRPPEPRFLVVNVVPWDFSSERSQNAEPDVAVHPNNGYRTQISSFQHNTVGAPDRDRIVPLGNHPFFITPGLYDPPLPEFPDRYWKLLHYGTNQEHNGSASHWAPSGRLWAAFRRDDPSGPTHVLNVGYKALTNISGLTNELLTQFTNIPASFYAGRLDRPWIRATTVAGRDRIYAAFNDTSDMGGGLRRGPVVRFSLNGGRDWQNANIERRPTGVGDAAPVRVAVNGDVVYAAFLHRTATTANDDLKVQLMVVRDNAAGNSAPDPFPALGLNGVNVTETYDEGAVSEITVPRSSFNSQDPPAIQSGTSLGHQPLDSDLSLAVDPTNPNRVFVAYTEVITMPGNTLTPQVRVAVSLNGGMNWVRNYTGETNSALPALAIAENGTVGLLYTRLRDGWLETRFIQTVVNEGDATALSVVLARFPDNTPYPIADSYIGKRQELECVNNIFYGAFAASNDPDPTNFPRGVFYQRNVEQNGRFRTGLPLIIAVTNKGRLVDTAGFPLASNAYAPQGISIDPFSVRVRAVKAVNPALPVVPMIDTVPAPAGVIDFAGLCRGTVAAKRVKVINKGVAALTITSIARLPGGSRRIRPGNLPPLPYTLLPDEEFSFDVECVPENFGLLAATIRITSNDPAKPNLDLMITANVVPPTIAVALPPPAVDPMDFGKKAVGDFQDLKLTITDTSGGRCSSRVSVTSSSAEFVIRPFVNRLAPGSPIEVTVRFRPTTPIRGKRGVITITGANPAQLPLTVNVIGDGLPAGPPPALQPLALVQAQGAAEYGIAPLGPINLFPGPLWGVGPFLRSAQLLSCPGPGFRTLGFGQDVWQASFPIAPIPGGTVFVPPPGARPFGGAATRMWATPAGGISWTPPTGVRDVPGDATASFNASRGQAWYLNPNPPGSAPLVTSIGATFGVSGFVPFGGQGGIGLRVNFNGLFPVQDLVPPLVVGIKSDGPGHFAVTAPPDVIVGPPVPTPTGFFFSFAGGRSVPIALGPGLFLLDSTLTMLADPGMEFQFDDTLMTPNDLPGIGAFVAPSNTVPPSVPEILSLNVRLAGTNVVLSWPAPAEGFVLEAAPHLVPPVPWREITERPAVSAVHTLSLPATPANRFFRLKRAQNPLAAFRTDFVPGDYASAGVGLRGSGIAGIATGALTISNVPANAEVIAAYLYWATMGNGATGSFNGGAIIGTPLGTNTVACDVLPEVVFYRADVLSLLPQTGGAVAANGTFPVQLPDSGNPVVAPSSAGASLVVIYQRADLPQKFISIHEGAHTLSSPVEAMQLRMEGFVSAANPQAKLTHIVANGAAARNDKLTFNGVALGNPTDAFAGAQGARWDNATFDVSALVHPYDTLAVTSAEVTGPSPDCLTWGAVLFSVNVITNAQEIRFGTNLTVTALAGDNGTVSPNGLFEVQPGATQVFTATPGTNYEVDTWYLDSAPAQTGGNTFTLSNIQLNHILGVSFKVVSTAVDLSIETEIAPPFGIAGEELELTITATNAGPGTAISVQVTNILPAGVTLTAATSSQGTCTNSGQILRCDLGNLAAGAFATITLTIAPSVEGIFTNAVSATSLSVDVTPANNAASTEMEVLALPVIVAEPESVEADAGNTVVFSVTASGSAPLRYQWYFGDGQVLVGETSSTLTLTSVTLQQEGWYYAVVSNGAGEVISAAVTLTVAPPVQPALP